MEEENRYQDTKAALLAQGKFFEDHTFIFKLLSSREERVVRLRCGMETGTVVPRRIIGEEYGVTSQRISQIEARAFKKMKNPKAVELLMNYTDDTFDEALYNDFEDHFKSLLREDIIRSIDEDSLKVLNDISIYCLPIEMRRCRSVQKRLYNGGVKTCGQLVELVKTNTEFKKFGLGKSSYNAITVALCSLIEGGYAEIVSQDISDEYIRNKKVSIPEIKHTNPNQKELIIDVPKKIRDMRIEELGFGNRTFHCLKRIKTRPINTVGDLIEFYNEHESLKASIKNFGDRCEQEVMAKFKELGINVQSNNELNDTTIDGFYHPKSY